MEHAIITKNQEVVSASYDFRVTMTRKKHFIEYRDTAAGEEFRLVTEHTTNSSPNTAYGAWMLRDDWERLTAAMAETATLMRQLHADRHANTEPKPEKAGS